MSIETRHLYWRRNNALFGTVAAFVERDDDDENDDGEGDGADYDAG